MTTAPVLEREVATKPPTRWFNWYEPPSWACWRDGGNEPYAAPKSWPSKDLAETKAARMLAKPKFSNLIYLGAYPEGQRP